MIEFLVKIILIFSLNYFFGSRYLYAYEINESSDEPFTIDVEKVIKNRVCKFIFPREFKTPREILDGVTKISMVGLIHFIFFYLPEQIITLISVVIYFKNKEMAENLSLIVFNLMFIGFGFYIAAISLSTLIVYIKKKISKKREKRK